MDKEKLEILNRITPEELNTLKKLLENSTAKPFGEPLPKDFDGVFRFTNYTDTEFITRWNNVEYTFPPNSTTPIMIPTATPLEIQNIRKKFAVELATLSLYKTDKFKAIDSIKDKKPPTWDVNELTPYIQRCLEPLPIGRVEVRELPRDTEKRYRKDKKGKPITRIVDQDESLVGDGVVMTE